MASLTRWAWVWVGSGNWWWTGRPGMLWFMVSQRVRLSDWTDSLTDWCKVKTEWLLVVMQGNFKGWTWLYSQSKFAEFGHYCVGCGVALQKLLKHSEIFHNFLVLRKQSLSEELGPVSNTHSVSPSRHWLDFSAQECRKLKCKFNTSEKKTWMFSFWGAQKIRIY